MNDEEVLAVAGAIAAAIAAVAWIAERRRLRRANLDRVGWVPWTALFFWGLIAAIVLIGLSIKLYLIS